MLIRKGCFDFFFIFTRKIFNVILKDSKNSGGTMRFIHTGDIHLGATRRAKDLGRLTVEMKFGIL